MAEADWIRDSAGLDALVPEWEALWRATPGASPFVSPAWLVPWWSAFRPGDLAVLTLRRAGALAGVLPLYGAGGVLRLLGAGLSDLQDALLPAVLAGEAAAALRTLEVPGPVRRVDLFDLDPDSALAGLPAPEGWAAEEGACDACPVLPLPRGATELEAVVPTAMVRNLRHTRRRAERMGGWSVAAAAADTLPGLLDALFALHGARWGGRGECGVLADPRVRAFHRAAAPRLLAAGVLRLYAGHVGGRLAAVHYGLASGGRSYYYIGGFAPELAKAGPGTLAVGHAIEQAVREGGDAFHFLRGRESYKYRWGAVDRWSRRRLLTVPNAGPPENRWTRH